MDRYPAEHEMYRKRKEAEIVNQAKSNFLTSMSHELHMPLNLKAAVGGVAGANKFAPTQAV